MPPTSRPKASANRSTLWRDEIIDGRNRYKACKLAGVEPVFKKIDFPGGEKEALAFVLSRNLKRRHLTKPQRDVVIAKLRSMPQWANASNRAIAKEIGVDEATVRRAQSLSASRDADAPQHTVTVKRGEQEYLDEGQSASLTPSATPFR